MEIGREIVDAEFGAAAVTLFGVNSIFIGNQVGPPVEAVGRVDGLFWKSRRIDGLLVKGCPKTEIVVPEEREAPVAERRAAEARVDAPRAARTTRTSSTSVLVHSRIPPEYGFLSNTSNHSSSVGSRPPISAAISVH